MRRAKFFFRFQLDVRESIRAMLVHVDNARILANSLIPRRYRRRDFPSVGIERCRAGPGIPQSVKIVPKKGRYLSALTGFSTPMRPNTRGWVSVLNVIRPPRNIDTPF